MTKNRTKKNTRGGPKWGREGIFPANKNLADILGDMDFDSENFYFLAFVGSFLIFIALFGVRRGFKMILNHRAPSSLNMSSYRPISDQISYFLNNKIPDPGSKILVLVHETVFTGGLPPPRPPAVPGGLQAPQTPWRGACSPPHPLAYF